MKQSELNNILKLHKKWLDGWEKDTAVVQFRVMQTLWELSSFKRLRRLRKNNEVS